MHFRAISATSTFELDFFYFVDWPLTPNWAAAFISRVTSQEKRELPLTLDSPGVHVSVTSCDVSVNLISSYLNFTKTVARKFNIFGFFSFIIRERENNIVYNSLIR